MNYINNMLAAIVMTGDDADPKKWIWIMVVVGVMLVVLAVASVVMSKKKNAQDLEEANKKDTNKADDKK